MDIALQLTTVRLDCLNKADYDHMLVDELSLYPAEGMDDEGFDNLQKRDGPFEHPCAALRKLLGDGSFYYSADFDLTSRLQERSVDASTFDYDNFDKGYLWNSYMIQPLVDFRTRLSPRERTVLDSSRILTSAIRGFAATLPVFAHGTATTRVDRATPTATLTLISRLSCRRAGTRFNARGVDDDGNVANFVETETILWSPSDFCFSSVQIRGSIPLFWEQSAGLLPGQQKISMSRSFQATQPAFDRHFEDLEIKYGSIYVVNLLSKEKQGELDLSREYQRHVVACSLNKRQGGRASSEHVQLKHFNYDFHAETRTGGYEAASGIRQYIHEAGQGFGFCLLGPIDEHASSAGAADAEKQVHRTVMVTQQQGVFRTNCLDCLDRTNLVQTIIGHMTLDAYLDQRGERMTADMLARHGTLWADNGDVSLL